jgi:hypothetical protein
MRFGSLRRSQPISRVFGLDRGQPIDRHYIEMFLSRYQNDVQGCVLEIAGREYTNKFGAGRTVQSDVLHAETGNPEATLVGDLATGAGIPRLAFDCILLTQTLPFIYDVKNAIVHTRDALRPRGVALVTVPGISQISRYDMDRWGDYWRFTDASARRLFAEVFGADNVTVTTYGNVLTACAFLHGLAAHELRAEELDHHDPDYQVIIGIRAIRPPAHRV